MWRAKLGDDSRGLVSKVQPISCRGSSASGLFHRRTVSCRDSKRGNGPPDCTRSAVRAVRIRHLRVGAMPPARRYRVNQACPTPHRGKLDANGLPNRAKLIGLCSDAQIVMPDQTVVKGQ
jgi:hypothetical protein